MSQDDRRAATAKLWGLADYSGAIERHASPDGGPVRFDAEYLLAQAR